MKMPALEGHFKNQRLDKRAVTQKETCWDFEDSYSMEIFKLNKQGKEWVDPNHAALPITL